MSAFNTQSLSKGVAQYPVPEGINYTYGTAGFRADASILAPVFLRVGLLSVLRSQKLSGKFVGVMVTASHNPENDNGVKMVDPLGEMLQQSWEAYGTKLANARTTAEVSATLEEIIAAEKIDTSVVPRIVYANDTRPSCPELVAALVAGFGASPKHEVINCQEMTTPQLHYAVYYLNTHPSEQKTLLKAENPGAILSQTYFSTYTDALSTLLGGKTPTIELEVDCANGIGAASLKGFLEVAKSSTLSALITPTNTKMHVPGALNSGCGADFVKTKQREPEGTLLDPAKLYCSYDGDADRIVFYYADTSKVFHLLDGDKIATLLAGYISELVATAGLQDSITLGVVQTAYANGASTHFLIETLKLPVTCVPTGVKHLHHAAQAFDIGVYFEANGHGTVLFSEKAQALFKEKSKPLYALSQLINQTVGDALSDMLAVYAVLTQQGTSGAAWDQSYTDLPNRLVKVLVKDRYAFTTTDAERTLVTPPGLQKEIDSIVASFGPSSRSFVRPSGTENCVRVYAEAATRDKADSLANTAASAVFKNSGEGKEPASYF